MVDDVQSYEKAKKRVEAKLSFYIHAAIYVVVNTVLIIINLTISTSTIWFFWPLLGWGIGLAFHGIGVFYESKTTLMKEQMIKNEMDKQQ